ncbi:caspase-10 isoform X2 [Dromiciops gliroides]|uniref:caspase-10 isoform X2 n=1 Tax=Dromiciops gliroides TaxID=33562 RepID=UPI001CC59D0D|nr:caspase-10 isoform X2 [Dromiciops gliroides]
MEDDNNVKFHQKLLSIDEKLEREDIEALIFLCSDLISPKNLQHIESAHQLFERLMKESLLNEEDCFLLAELLFLIKQHYLLPKIDYTKEQVLNELSTKRKISPYRIMLYNLSEEITNEEFKNIKFLVHKDIPKTLTSFLSLLKHMEKQELLSENNLDMLVTICESVSKNLIKRINQYKHEEKKKLSLTSGTANRSVEASAEKNMEAVKYRMDHKYRGRCIIFNNYEFQTMNYREGSCKDADDLRSVFEWLGFTVTIHHNTTEDEMKEILMLCRIDPMHQDSDCFVCCVLTHGESGCVFSSDEKSIAIYELTSYFMAHECRGLINKPKLFFFQACQGTDIQEGVFLQADAKKAKNSLSVTKNIPQRCIPKEADFLLGMATVDGCSAIRHRVRGSWYIQALCHQLKRLVPRQEDILTILTVVNNDVSQQGDLKGTMKQIPQPAFTLLKKVIFPVPPDDPPPAEENFL